MIMYLAVYVHVRVGSIYILMLPMQSCRAHLFLQSCVDSPAGLQGVGQIRR